MTTLATVRALAGRGAVAEPGPATILDIPKVGRISLIVTGTIDDALARIQKPPEERDRRE